MEGRRADDLDAHGVLRTPADGHFEARRYPARSPQVEWGWSVEWDRGGRPPHEQHTIGSPVTHITVEDGTTWVHGPYRGRFDVTLTDAGRVVAVRLRVGALRALIGGPVSALADARHPAAVVAGLDGPAVAARVAAERDVGAAVGVLQEALAPVLAAAPEDPDAPLAERAVELLRTDRSIVRSGDLAARLHVSTRTLQRLFASHVGLGPAGVVRRFRLQDALQRALAGEAVDWGRVAVDLGYYDQAHLVREFTAAVGVPPARYARLSA